MELENIVANTVYLKAREAADGKAYNSAFSYYSTEFIYYSLSCEVEGFRFSDH